MRRREGEARGVGRQSKRVRGKAGGGGEVCRAHPRQLTLTLTLTLTRCVGLTPASHEEDSCLASQAALASSSRVRASQASSTPFSHAPASTAPTATPHDGSACFASHLALAASSGVADTPADTPYTNEDWLCYMGKAAGKGGKGNGRTR